MSRAEQIIIGDAQLTWQDVTAVARHGATPGPVGKRLGSASTMRRLSCRASSASGERAYGVNTGLGALCNVSLQARATEPSVAQYPAQPCLRSGSGAARRADPSDHLRRDHQLQPGQLRNSSAGGRGVAGLAQPSHHAPGALPGFGRLSDPHGAHRRGVAGRRVR
jgi:hypothetical protein